MKCESVQEALSAAMDRAPGPSERQLEHARTCPVCSRFAEQTWRLRELARFEVAPPVPDLVPRIMQLVRDEARVPSLVRRTRWISVPAIAAALVVGLVVGFVLTSGGTISRRLENMTALADEIPQRLQQAAVGLDAYRATFDVTELGWTRAVPRRTFRADVAFEAPESFRVDVRDTTTYPSAEWPRNDLLLVTDGPSYRATGPDPCPAAALPDCPQPAPIHRAIVHRAPFDPRSPAPTDVIVPMTVLAASDRVDVRGSGDAAGRPAVVVQVAYQDALPLFRYLTFLGSWRPFFPQDRVLVWLDRQTWFPLRYELFPASGPERALWAEQQGLAEENPGTPVFVATARTLSTAAPPAGTFAVASESASDEEFQDRSPATLDRADRAGMQPAETAGLAPWRYGSYERTPTRPYDESILAYARGLGWLTVTRVVGWDQQLLFGLGPFAEPVALPNGHGVAYYEPASAGEPRRVAIHTAGGEYLVSTNLPRTTLLEVAGSLPSVGVSVPPEWRTRRWSGGVVEEGLTAGEAVARVGFQVLLPEQPGGLPAGYRAVAGQVFRGRGTEGLALAYRRPAAELDGVGLRVFEAAGQVIPPPTRADEQAVPVRGVVGRWSPSEHLLEWIEGELYVSLSGPVFDLTDLLVVAESLRPAEVAP